MLADGCHAMARTRQRPWVNSVAGVRHMAAVTQRPAWRLANGWGEALMRVSRDRQGRLLGMFWPAGQVISGG
jgi:hypothetical protein